MRPFRLLTLAGLLMVGACSTLHYYGQSISGHLSLMAKRRPIETVLNDPASGPRLKQRLHLAETIRSFASAELRLPENRSYLSYVDVEREYVLWNLFAAPEFSLEPLRWCFPVAGCLEYRGFFSKRAAEHDAERLRLQGHDVFVSGVAAYSTLGWFDDPILSTMLRWDDARLARVIFHELAHQHLYIPGDTTFNESFATAVAREGVKRWLQQTADPTLAEAVANEERRDTQFLELVMRTRRRLEVIYGASMAVPELRHEKREIFEDLRREYTGLKQSWGGYDGYDDWMDIDLNNAKIASVVTYNDYVGAFESILAAVDDRIVDFYRYVERLARLPAARRHDCLDAFRSGAQARSPDCPPFEETAGRGRVVPHP
jgi:predicted aminopeptidase